MAYRNDSSLTITHGYVITSQPGVYTFKFVDTCCGCVVVAPPVVISGIEALNEEISLSTLTPCKWEVGS